MKLGTQLVASFSIMLVLMMIIGTTGYMSARRTQRSLNSIFATRLPGIDNLIEADRDLYQGLTAERSLIFLNTDSEHFKTLAEEYDTNIKQALERFGIYKQLANTDEEKELIANFERTWKEWQPISQRVVDGRKADTREGRREALDLTTGLAFDKFEAMRDNLDKLTVINLDLAENDHHKAVQTFASLTLIIILMSVFGLLTGVFFMWTLNREITKPLNRIIDSLTESTKQVASASEQVSSSSQQLAESSSEQAASLEEISSSL